MPIAPPKPTPNLIEVNKNISRWNAKKAQSRESDPPPSPALILLPPPPSPADNPIATDDALPRAGVPASRTNPIDIDSPTSQAPPTIALPVNPITPEPMPDPRLSAPAVVSGGAMPSEAATSLVGEKQGVTSASLQLTLPGTPSGRTGKKGAWKTTPNKPRKTLPPEDQRTHCVSVRFSTAELARLTTDMQVQHKKELAAVVRDAYLHGPRSVVPPVNLDKWRELARAIANLNQIALLLNSEVIPEDFRPFLDKLARQIHLFRAELLGQKEGK